MRRGVHRSVRFLGAALAVAALGAAGAASAQEVRSGTQQTPDSRRYLINKNVGLERWAISFNLEDRTVTGNVFKADGSDPSFVWCRITGETAAAAPADNEYVLDCYGADACEGAPCSDADWVPIASGLVIGGSFLLPAGTQATFRGRIEPVFNARCASAGCHAGATPAQGLDLAQGSAYDAIFRVQSREEPEHLLIEPFDPEASHLVHKLEGDGTLRMPLGAPPLSEEEIASFVQWVREGAADN